MKLYYSPGVCSLAIHIALEEAGIPFELERVDLKSKKTESGGANFTVINPKGYVPALVLDSGEMLTENLAVLDWIATQSPSLGLQGPLGRTPLLEALAYISTEIHKSFKPLFIGGSGDDTPRAWRIVAQRLGLLAERRQGPYLRFGVAIRDAFLALRGSMVDRPAVRKAMEREGLPVPLVEGAFQRRTEVA